MLKLAVAVEEVLGIAPEHPLLLSTGVPHHPLDELKLLFGLIQPPERHQAISQVQPGIADDFRIGPFLLQCHLQRLRIQYQSAPVILEFAINPPQRVETAPLEKRVTIPFASDKGIVEQRERLLVLPFAAAVQRLIPLVLDAQGFLPTVFSCAAIAFQGRKGRVEVAGEPLYYAADQNVPDRDEVERRDIVASWERTYGADERVPEA